MSSREVKEHSEEAVQLDIRPSTQSPHQKRSCIYSAKLEEPWDESSLFRLKLGNAAKSEKHWNDLTLSRISPEYDPNTKNTKITSYAASWFTSWSQSLHTRCPLRHKNQTFCSKKFLHETLCLWHSKAYNTSANYSKLLPLKTLHQKRVCTKSLY